MEQEHLKMRSINIVDENIKKIAELFPNTLTEVEDEKGNLKQAIDFDVLKQELSDSIVSGREERYQFTWPEKRNSILLANSPISETLRPCVEESLGKDGTPGKFDSENLYIEGDNLDVLKLLQQTYMNNVDFIYIDPPYNTNKDFIYPDDFSMSSEEYLKKSSQFNAEGQKLVQNTENNGRFHTNWLNLIYPRLKIAKKFLSEDGVIFISIDYNENYNMRKMCNEIFGDNKFIGEIYWESKTKSQNTTTSFDKLQPKNEVILVYSNNPKKHFNLISIGEKEYPLSDKSGKYREYTLELMNASGMRGRKTMIYAIEDNLGNKVTPPDGKQWKFGVDEINKYKERDDLFIRDDKVILKKRPTDEKSTITEPFWGFFSKEIGTAESAKKELYSMIGDCGFETVKPVNLIKKLIFHATEKTSIIMDFFSGSATTAQATMQLNSEDGGIRKFILVQIPENTETIPEAIEAGFNNICEIGKERIRRASNKIREENPLVTQEQDLGFRVLKLDSTNMKDIYYTPEEIIQGSLDGMLDNIKEDRTPEDLLFQAMLELAIPLSSSIEESTIASKKVFNVNAEDNYLLACFDSEITNEIITEIAKKKPYYFVMRDNSMANDSVATNFEQIFKTYSPETKIKVL